MPQSARSTGRFMTLDQVAEELATSRAQAYALVRSGELPAIKVGGRGQWRVESSDYLGVRPGEVASAQVRTLMTRPQRVGCVLERLTDLGDVA
ncbi:helix-turn-helix domain-containing protein [Segeticoccus rhizosphaerae]|uniref:helix-turn-helix domain-containing protein n=1 Tax=Segeticoccus rhizosphaerae TaxID=1104777 RepID=UPI00126510A4|nr:helix-turn-helix domain-containing protein [Segeticoccus rhizosphaerae]